jgi:hypothetical protein
VRPDVLDWVTAVGTAGATLLAAIAIAMQVRDRRRSAEDDRRRQAGLVSAWISKDTGLAVAAASTVQVHVRNGSDELVYGVWLHPTDPKRLNPVDIGIVDPRSERTLMADASVGDPWTIPFELEFVDARGRHWRRYPDGRLDEIRMKPREQRTS